MKNLVNFNTSGGKSEYLHFDGLLLLIAYKVSTKKVQKSHHDNDKLTFCLKNLIRSFMSFNSSIENLKNWKIWKLFIFSLSLFWLYTYIQFLWVIQCIGFIYLCGLLGPFRIYYLFFSCVGTLAPPSAETWCLSQVWWSLSMLFSGSWFVLRIQTCGFVIGLG